MALALYALAYPVLNLLAGHQYPATPTFSVPCPTGILTVGLLFMTAGRPPIAVIVVPFLWAVIGGSAALVLGITTDYVLLACSVLLVLDVARTAPALATARCNEALAAA